MSSLKTAILTEMFLHLRPSYESISSGGIHLISIALPKYYQTRTVSRAGKHTMGRKDPQLLEKVKTREQQSYEANYTNEPRDRTGVVRYFCL